MDGGLVGIRRERRLIRTRRPGSSLADRSPPLGAMQGLCYGRFPDNFRALASEKLTFPGRDTTGETMQAAIRFTKVARTRELGLALALAMSTSAANAVKVDYDFVNVGYAFGSGNNGTEVGSETLIPVSSNLPVTFTGGIVNYQFGTLTPGFVSTGTWSWTSGTDSLYGTFETVTQQGSFQGTPFVRYTGTRAVDGGTGYFTGASGSGTNEFYAYYFDTGVPGVFGYHGVDIARMSVSVDTDSPIPQDDVRPVVVLVKNGVEDLVAGTGTSSGVFTSRSPGMPQFDTETSDYTFQPLPIAGPPFAGTFADTGPTGILEGSSYGNNIAYNHLGSLFTYATGLSTFTGGTDAFATATGTSDYESIAIGTGGPLDAATYSNVVISRVNPIPEPSAYAMLVAGLALLGFVVRRRIAA